MLTFRFSSLQSTDSVSQTDRDSAAETDMAFDSIAAAAN